MRLSLPSPGAGGQAGRRAESVELPSYLPTCSFFQTNTAVAEAFTPPPAPSGAEEAGAGPGRGDPFWWQVGGFRLGWRKSPPARWRSRRRPVTGR